MSGRTKSGPDDEFDPLATDIEDDDPADSSGADLSDMELAGSDMAWHAGQTDAEGLTGMEAVAFYVKQLPNSPGVYRMMNAGGDVLYVGKARSLKKRVSNYAHGRFHTNRIGRMVAETASMEFIVTRTETEALLLEANLIKRLRPRFNVLLRDDKSFPYILLGGGNGAPGLFKHRGARSAKGEYFGPFASAGAVGRTINALQRAFLLRTCADSVFESRTRPCLLHQIKRCAAPCTGEISAADYAALVGETRDFLSGRSSSVKAHIQEAMGRSAEELDFERAAVFRDRLSALSHVQAQQGINPQSIEEADVFAIHQEGGQSCIEVFFFRTGQNWGNRAYFPRADATIGPEEVLGAFLTQFYDDKPCPRMILLSHAPEEHELLEAAFSARSGKKVAISVPMRGEKKEIVGQVLQNAREALGRRLAETSSQTRLLAGFAETFGLKTAPRRIEVFDNSHIMGTNAVGGMIVAGPEGFAKGQYRKFNIKSETITPGDDFGMMAEVMERRFSRLVKEHAPQPEALPDGDDSLPAWPDVVLIDGGPGQMSAVRGILGKLGLLDTVTAIGIAKGQDREAGRERFFMEGKTPFTLPPRDPVLYFIQRLRDEAHRFAIGTHRAKRKKEMVRNPLDEIAGIGPARKRALLQHFGTAKAVGQAGIADLLTVEGVSEAMARQIYGHFHEKG